jgi:AraC-like DNA-binding protein
MNYRFMYPVMKRYHDRRRFMEILYLDSIEAVHRDEESEESEVKTGFNVTLNQGTSGEIRFSANTAVRGVRIVVAEEFYKPYVKGRFGEQALTPGTLNREPELRLALGQVKRSTEREVDSESYYESKVIELLYWIGAGENPRALPQKKHGLTREDFEAVNKVKDVIARRVSSAPKISELTVLTGTSATKLQNDFKSAQGCTIHEYVQQVRMAEALRKMENMNEPLYTIAHSVGFKKPGRFSEVFKNTYGIAPSEYAKLVKSRNEI